MSVVSPSRPQVSLPASPSPAERAVEKQPGPTPAEPASTLGDRWAVLLYATCGSLLAVLLVQDLVGAFFRAIFGG